jgi:hypothetical protein
MNKFSIYRIDNYKSISQREAVTIINYMKISLCLINFWHKIKPLRIIILNKSYRYNTI